MVFDAVKFYRDQIAYYEKQIEWENRQIAWYTDQIKRDRRDDKELVEHVWSKGPLTKTEMEIFGDFFVSTDTKRDLRQRSTCYRRRRKYTDRIEQINRKLAQEVK